MILKLLKQFFDDKSIFNETNRYVLSLILLKFKYYLKKTAANLQLYVKNNCKTY